MMSSYLGVAQAGPSAAMYQQHPSDAFLDDISRQMAISQASRRLSRGSTCQQRAGSAMSTAMRVVKPTSANSSPRSTMAARRRTLMGDGSLAARRRQQVVDQNVWPLTQEMPSSQTRPSRPLSWHPSSYYHGQMSAPAQQHLAQYPFPTYNDYELASGMQSHYSPVPAYSCSTSPNSAFSPLALPYNSFDAAPCLPVEGWGVAPQPTPSYVSAHVPSTFVEPFPVMPTCDYASSNTTSQWNSFAAHGFNSTSPPTPENLPQAQQQQPVVSSEDAIPYEPLNEAEEEGEILVGMGLYDAPDKYEDDPQLSHSRSAMSSLLGAPYRGQEGTGKGLKLEESWQPPESDDEDEDGEGEATDETAKDDDDE
ncbi:hypothetical protein D7B24_004424 [Verticillium nonalfalfae]|uniref:Uncharacterized protein n=1 Tax=Verticillium nonalfalfae TaxID=1051616 RepID=A0A3M9XUW3_9PEZI|nr:uncharacterized protein D7B24_004424 [Verticillium nonalfalfae]RNJ52077.1 hypothetical protein D7B24_004424 [Verticillium nonalfalfae]